MDRRDLREGRGMGISVYDAIVLKRRNKERYERLHARGKRLNRHSGWEGAAQEERRRAVYDRALVPFREHFGRLRHIDLAALAPTGPARRHAVPDIELRELRELAVGGVGSLLGGAAAGTAVSTAAYMAVGAFATASTGTAISTLSGAAASSATLAWLGGGSLAAGGGGVAAGTTVLMAAFALPALLVAGGLIEWRGRAARRGQQEQAEELTAKEAHMDEERRAFSEVLRRSREIRLVLLDLGLAMEKRLPALAALVDANDDYAACTAPQRALVKEVFDVACTIVTVMAAPPADGNGRVTEVSGRVLADARARLREWTITP
ncbi:hypothetical protein GCM10010387_03200 [Streptomyces inusitatus]|uniref:Uncharacterized protein n=1 Tax=Streptomyces inusitatus TaxID=68221 RepID=A0A918PMZ9_9ACTN|nr:hypothetical protein [Streptomyces inusitatus]GGZ14451.1 hypothetical protein GCM10010387_03200 [Streptomyces inusitatus]